MLGAAFHHDVIDEPTFETAAPGPDIDLDAVLLHVGAGGEEQSTPRNCADLPRLTALIEPLPVRRFAGLNPRQAQHAVLEAALGLVGDLRSLPHPGDIRPRKPANR